MDTRGRGVEELLDKFLSATSRRSADAQFADDFRVWTIHRSNLGTHRHRGRVTTNPPTLFCPITFPRRPRSTALRNARFEIEPYSVFLVNLLAFKLPNLEAEFGSDERAISSGCHQRFGAGID